MCCGCAGRLPTSVSDHAADVLHVHGRDLAEPNVLGLRLPDEPRSAVLANGSASKNGFTHDYSNSMTVSTGS